MDVLEAVLDDALRDAKHAARKLSNGDARYRAVYDSVVRARDVGERPRDPSSGRTSMMDVALDRPMEIVAYGHDGNPLVFERHPSHGTVPGALERLGARTDVSRVVVHPDPHATSWGLLEPVDYAPVRGSIVTA